MKNDEYMKTLAIYIIYIFRDFENFLETEVDLVQDDVRLVLDEYISSFITDELEVGIYNFNDLSEVLFNILQSEYPGPSNVIDSEIDDISMKTKLVVSAGILAIRFDQKSFFSTILAFTPHCDYKNHNEYISQKLVNLNTKDKILFER